MNISAYLSNKNKATNKGDCKVCSRPVPWSNDKLGQHKRGGNCIGQTTEDRLWWKKLVETSSVIVNKIGNSINSIENATNCHSIISDLTKSSSSNNTFTIDEDVHVIKQRKVNSSCSD